MAAVDKSPAAPGVFHGSFHIPLQISVWKRSPDVYFILYTSRIALGTLSGDGQFRHAGAVTPGAFVRVLPAGAGFGDLRGRHDFPQDEVAVPFEPDPLFFGKVCSGQSVFTAFPCR